MRLDGGDFGRSAGARSTPGGKRHSFLILGACMKILIALSLLSLTPAPLLAHPGGVAADGCHDDRKNGGRHCHGGPASGSRSAEPLSLSSSRTTYGSCAEARAAGAAPLRAGDDGYSRKLDRDGDGVACE
jgi:hypothetical protein